MVQPAFAQIVEGVVVRDTDKTGADHQSKEMDLTKPEDHRQQPAHHADDQRQGTEQQGA